MKTPIKILHIDSNHPLLWRQLQEAGFVNHEDFVSTKEQIEAKIQDYQGIVIRSRFKIDKTFLDKSFSLQFIARVGAGLESINFESATNDNTMVLMNFSFNLFFGGYKVFMIHKSCFLQLPPK